jgi:hypothetical protein
VRRFADVRGPNVGGEHSPRREQDVDEACGDGGEDEEESPL